MKKKINILIVEDNPDDFFLLKEILESSDEAEFEIFHEYGIEKAKTAAKNNQIDAAIIDLSLPDSFGIDTFFTFHKLFPLIPVVIMTGSRDHELALEIVKKGAQDYLFKGDLSAASIVRTLRYAIERQHLTTKLKDALEQVKQLKGMLPICSSCKKIRDDKGYWQQIEAYISKHSDATFTHGICPCCIQELYPEFVNEKK
ncbi:Two component system response regulator [Desulfonema limicola]|uniref:Two component system response regulator n=1 Tax=Desulfonema limicola TaxID=45656 RepID=A0A975B8L7_9BACT|nr:response regulator [Desulfonema limicola]QTA80600.1 Two component system response regulator [Desulfonema limicola]